MLVVLPVRTLCLQINVTTRTLTYNCQRKSFFHLVMNLQRPRFSLLLRNSHSCCTQAADERRTPNYHRYRIDGYTI
jgi:hypothetical protein